MLALVFYAHEKDLPSQLIPKRFPRIPYKTNTGEIAKGIQSQDIGLPMTQIWYDLHSLRFLVLFVL